jgi:hypothetical protein
MSLAVPGPACRDVVICRAWTDLPLGLEAHALNRLRALGVVAQFNFRIE